MKKTIALFSALLFITVGSFARIKLPKIFGNNMVLQRNKPISIWGWASVNENITVQFNRQTKKTVANNSGKWELVLLPENAGGPFLLSVKGKNSVVIENILVGEVWVCSGQSNMEMPIEGWGKINNYQQEISNADYPQIRQFKVPNTVSTTLLEDVTGGQWKVCSPATAGEFSATAYFFARELYKKLKVPVGLINTSWGGTQSEAWTSEQAFKQSPELKYIATEMKGGKRTINLEQRSENITKTIQKVQGNFINNAVTTDWKNNNFDDSKWPVMTLPGLWESKGLPDLDGTVWFRKSVTISESAVGKAATLDLSMIDDNDETYINGVKIGSTAGYSTKRKYFIESGILKAGKNTIAVKVEDTGGGGGIYGDGADMKITIDNNEQSLAGDWSFNVSAIKKSSLNSGPNDYPALLFNAMIYPLIKYSIKGVIWYQGESNAGRAYQYRTAFPLMINDWRQHFKQGNFPFLFVQLATFGSADANSKNGSNWAELREAQSMTLRLPNTGMAVTTDIGNPADIHPKNKQDVGKRLALIALHAVYNKAGEYIGPTFQNMKVTNNEATLSFSNIGSGFNKDESIIKGFEIAGADKQFHPATAMIAGDKIIVSSDEVLQPVSVRYNWADDASAGNLFNKEKLPAAPFRTDSWKGITVDKKYAIGR